MLRKRDTLLGVIWITSISKNRFFMFAVPKMYGHSHYSMRTNWQRTGNEFRRLTGLLVTRTRSQKLHALHVKLKVFTHVHLLPSGFAKHLSFSYKFILIK